MKRKIGLFILGILSVLCLFLISSSNSKYEEKEEIREIIVDNTIEKEDCTDFANLLGTGLDNRITGFTGGGGSLGTGGSSGSSGWGYAGLALGAGALWAYSQSSTGSYSSSSSYIGSLTKPSTATSNGGYSSSPNSTNEEIAKIAAAVSLSDLADKLLDEAEDTYGWTSDELADSLKKALKVVSGNTLLAIIDELKDDFTVYLGRHTDDETSYDQVAKQENGAVIFSLEKAIWDDLSEKHGEGMWLLNQLFLNYCMSHSCKFKLLTNPNEYYDYNSKQKISTYDDDNDRYYYTYYSYELEHIHVNGYTWNTSFKNLPVLATRG